LSHEKALEEIERAWKQSKLEKKRKERLLYERIFKGVVSIWWCPKCRIGIMRSYPEGDTRFPERAFREAFGQCLRCDSCGHKEYIPFD